MAFRQLRVSADVLRLAATTHPALRPFAVELFRGQTEFNHRLVDVLEELPWLAPLPDRAARIEARLGPWTSAATDVRNARGGARGWLVTWAKRAGLVGLEAGLAAARRGLTETNRAVVDALKARRALPEAPPRTATPGLEAWFAAQHAFYAEAALLAAIPPASVPHRPPASNASAVRVAVIAPGQTVPAGADVVLRRPPDEALADGALDAIAAGFADPRVVLVYGDTFLSARGAPALKPAWSPDLLLSWNYIGGCFALRADHARTLDPGAPALQWLLAAPLEDAQVVRLPHVLSVRPEPAEDAAQDLAVVRAHLAGRGTTEPRGAHRAVHLAPPAGARVSIIVPFRDRVDLLDRLWQSLTRFDPGLPFELLLVSNHSTQPATFAWLDRLTDPRVVHLRWDHPFNWSAINDFAARHATGDLLLFLNNDVEATHAGWLRALAGWAASPGVGVAGAHLLHPDGALQHAGMVIGLRDLAGHMFARWRPEYDPTPFGPPDVTRNWSAVTGACLMIRRSLFESLGGFDPRSAVSGGDVELCLRVRQRGLRVVCAAEAVLVHRESSTRGRAAVSADDVRFEREAYAGVMRSGDPYHHPALSNEVGTGLARRTHLTR